MLRSLRLQHVGPADEMEFAPNKRLNVITGDNGLGKSFLLDLAWWAVTRSWSSIPVQPPLETHDKPSVEVEFVAATKTARLRVEYDRSNQAWRFPKGKPGQPGLVVYARVDGDFAIWDSNRRFGDREEFETGIPKGLVFARDQVWNGYVHEGKPICNGLLADWTSWQQTRSWEAAALARTLELMSPSEEAPVEPGAPMRTDVLDSRLIPTLRMPYGQDVPITQASAGMKRILALAYLLVWAWREHLEVSRLAGRATAERMLVIVDEIEAHLHPKWQRVILSSIIEALTKLTRDPLHRVSAFRPPTLQYIVATHSPLVLASIEPLFDEKNDGLFELQLQDQGSGPPRVVLDEATFRRRGAAENWLISDAFGLSSSRSVPAEKVLAAAAALLEDGRRPSAVEIAAMTRRLSDVLPDVDPFWTRWRAVVEKRA